MQRPPEDAELITLDDNWCGGWYDLGFELGPGKERLDAAMRALAVAAKIDGWYARRDLEPDQQDRVQCVPESLRASIDGHLYGHVRLPNGARTVCAVMPMREEDGSNEWLAFYIPQGALDLVVPRDRFPFDGPGDMSSMDWRRPIDEWLAQVGSEVYAATRFRLALIGHEAWRAVSAADLEGKPPQGREFGYLIPDGPTVRYLPAEY